MTDLIGLSTLITSLTAAIGTGFAIWRGRERDKKITVLHDLVNGQSEKLNKAIGAGAYAEGKAEGIAAERANPQIPAT